MKVGLISDTHGQLRSQVFDHFDGVDLILHAGDIGNAGIITELEAIAPVRAVHGNTDSYAIAAAYGEQVALTLEGSNLVLLHDLCDTMTHGSLCALGGLTPLPVLSALRHFPEDFA